MNIITKGLGTDQLITEGYGFWKKLEEKIKEITEKVSRMLPKERRKFTFKVLVQGDLIVPLLAILPVKGKAVEFNKLAILLEDDEHPFEDIYEALLNNDQAYLKELFKGLKEDD